MNEIALISFIGVIIVFLYSVYRLMFVKDKPEMIEKWKISLMLIIISSILFFLFFTSAIGDIGVAQTITAGTETFTIKSNNYLQAFNFMPLVSGIYLLQWLFFIVNILQGFGFFGRKRMQP